MNNIGNIELRPLLIALFCVILISCNNAQSGNNEPVLIPDEKEMVEVEDNGEPQFEVVLPDSGLMENINPEEIITDDWTSDSPDAEASED